MDLEDRFLAKVSGVQSLSSSVHSTPEKNGHSDDASRSPELLQEFLKSGPKKELFQSCFQREKKNSASSKSKMTENFKTSNKTMKKQESKKISAGTIPLPSCEKQNRKSENPKRVSKQSQDYGTLNSWICKNSACKATLSIDDSFCKRCSCCLCHMFDDNKDPSLWLVCASESGEGDYCGMSCHIECALQNEKIGVVDLGQLMQLDGSYCCASCGKVSGIIGCWKKQLIVAKDARRLDVLCHRIYLSYRLLDGTFRFKELHEIVIEAKAKLETETGPVNGTSAKMARGIVSRLSIANEVQKLCSLAIEKADEWLVSVSNDNLVQDSLPAACKFIFEEVTPSSVVIILIMMSSATFTDLKGYKLWYYKTREESPTKEPVCVFPKTQRRISISNLQPCTEYTFRIVSYAEAGDLGHSEVKCFTKSIEIIQRNLVPRDHKKENLNVREQKNTTMNGSSDFQVRDLGKFLRMTLAQKKSGSYQGFCRLTGTDKCCGDNDNKPETLEQDNLPSGSCGLDLNMVTVPDLNEELTPPFDSSRDEDDNGYNMDRAIEGDDENIVRSNGSGDSQMWARTPAGDAEAIDFLGGRLRSKKREGNLNEEIHESDSTLVNGSNDSVSLDENFEYCVKTIRWLECEGHINQEFRLKLLTWFSLRSTEQERRVVHTFIQTLIDDPSSLAGQLVDTFSDIVSIKRLKNGFCGKLWH